MSRIRLIRCSVLMIGLAVAIRIGIGILLELAPDSAAPPILLTEQFDPYLSRIEVLRKCHLKKVAPQPGDWLERLPEGGQTFAQYVKICDMTPLHETFQGIDIQPLGDFDETQRRLIIHTADFVKRFFGVPVRTPEPVPWENIPPEARQMRNDVEQIQTKWIMNECLLPHRRPEAMATIGLATCDLWTLNFSWVFGEAFPSHRLGLWSLHRMGDPHPGDAHYRLCLLRTVKTAVHEIGHILGMPHCSQYECGMNGTRSIEEHDRRWLEFCPDCQAKIWWTCNINPIERCRLLAEFSETMDWDREAKLFHLEESLLKNKSKP